MNRISLLLISVVTLIATSCYSTRNLDIKSNMPEPIDLISQAKPAERYDNLTRGVNLAVLSEVEQSNIIDNSELSSIQRVKYYGRMILTPLNTFVDRTISNYMRWMGIKVNSDNASDYRLRVIVKEFKLVRQSSDSRATVVLEYSLSTNNNEKLFTKTARGRYVSSESEANMLAHAYDAALKDIDWQEIVDALTTHAHADQEAQRQVHGDGDTALEHTVIRWFIDSSPKGADVTWRVVSSTPDVKNTNSTYVGTTPYETTETFDIRGLKMENSGNVQIEVTCEKAGYITQRRRFNLRQVIEQKEISSKFNLIKEE